MSHYGSYHRLELVHSLKTNQNGNGHIASEHSRRYTTVLEKSKIIPNQRAQFEMPTTDETVCSDTKSAYNVGKVKYGTLTGQYELATMPDETSSVPRSKGKSKCHKQTSNSFSAIVNGGNASGKEKARNAREPAITNRGGNKPADMSAVKASRRGKPKSAVSLFPCTVCGKIFRERRYLHKHAETHDAAHTCEVCGKTYRSKAYLKLHSRCHPTPETTQRPRFFCSECNFSSDVAAAIHAHRQVHAPSDSVRCAICGGAYADRAALSKHRRVHDAARPFACPLPGCAWRFRTDVMCRAHVRAHTIAGRFKCSTCGYVFRRKHHLQRHEVRMHANADATTDHQHKNESVLRESSVTLRSSSAAPSSSSSTTRSRRSRNAAPLPSTPPVVQPASSRRPCIQPSYVTSVPDVEAAMNSNAHSTHDVFDLLLSTVDGQLNDDVPAALEVNLNSQDLMVVDDPNFSSLLDISDAELDKKSGPLIVDYFDLFP